MWVKKQTFFKTTNPDLRRQKYFFTGTLPRSILIWIDSSHHGSNQSASNLQLSYW